MATSNAARISTMLTDTTQAKQQLLERPGINNLLAVAEQVQACLTSRGEGDWSEWLGLTWAA